MALSLLAALVPVARAQGREYAVEVASLLSKECAVELTNGLAARGFESFWVRDQRPEYEGFYRVRVGRFGTLGTARDYAESLLDSGLLDTCAITVYDAPLSSIISASSTDRFQPPVETVTGPIGAYCPIKLPEDNNTREEDLTASITRSRWLISTGQKVPPLAQTEKVTSPLRDVVLLMRAIDKKSWAIKGDVSRMIAASGIGGTGVSISEAPANPSPVAPPPVPASVETPAPVAASVDYDPLDNASRRRGALSRAQIEGNIELQGGRLMLRLRNVDSARPFNGSARITLTGERQNNDIQPISFSLRPDEEKLVAVNEASSGYGDWMLMVYDDRRAIQLIRSASFDKTQEFNGPSVASTQPDLSPEPAHPVASIQPAANGIPAASSSIAPPSNGETPAEPPQDSHDQLPQLTVTPKQTALSGESVTLELDIGASQPINYLKIVLRAGDYQSEKIAVLTGKRGRVPFLIPARDALSLFSYQIVDDLGRSLANGTADFRTVSK